MAKTRVHVLAKELQVASADVIHHANSLGIEVKTASSGLTEEEVELIKLSIIPSVEDKEDIANEEVSSKSESIDEEPAESSSGDKTPDESISILEVSEEITPSELTELIDKDSADIVGDLLKMGIMASTETPLNNKDIEKLLEEYGYIADIQPVVRITRSDIIEVKEFDDVDSDLKPRPPIVTVMGHVDHGKTSLLDYIRKDKVVSQEAGGITQHVGAYKVELKEGEITFIDTPGHEAFTKMRARGANVTDIVVLVVASDDGVMPQTVEAINHTKSADVPMIVAINKCDLAESNPAKVKADLTQHGIVTEDLGGDVPSVEVSAETGNGIDELLETIVLVGDVEEIKANYEESASGYVVESRIEVGKGPVATVIVTRGILNKGDTLFAGTTSCRVKGLFSHDGSVLDNISPGCPVEIMGWDEAPDAGDQFVVEKNNKIAKDQALKNKQLLKDLDISSVTSKSRMQELMKLLEEGEITTINLIIKADTHGSVEAIKDGVLKLENDEVSVEVVHQGVGGVIESDVHLASATNSMVIGFNVRPDSKARKAAESKGIEVRTYSIIYELLDDISEAVLGKMTVKVEEKVIGMVDVKTTFKAPKVGVVAGSVVSEGRVDIDSNARLLRDGIVIYEGTIVSLRRFKDNVDTVSEGLECGIGLSDFKDIKDGDVIEVISEE